MPGGQSWHASCCIPVHPSWQATRGAGLVIGTGASHAHAGDAEGPVVGGLPAPFLCAKDSRDKKKPGIAGLFAEAPTPGRAGTGGIQISPPDVDIEPLLPLTSESDATGQLIVRSLRRRRGESNGRTPSGGCFSAPADGWHSPSVRMTVAAAARDAPPWPVPGAPCAVAAARPHAARRAKKSRGEDDSHPHSCVAGWAMASRGAGDNPLPPRAAGWGKG